MLFLGLAWAATPSGIGLSAARFDRARVSGTLSLMCDLSRLEGDVPAPVAGVRAAPLPEWLRLAVAGNSTHLRASSPLPTGALSAEGR